MLDALLEGPELLLALSVELHHREADDLVSERLRVEHGPIGLDDPGSLEGAHATQTRGRGQTDPAGQLDIRDAAVVLKLFENSPVYGIKASAHGTSGGMVAR